MRTLIELYDTSPIRNVLATVMFRPQEMILICPPEVAEDPNQKRSLRDFFAYLNCPVKLTLIPVTLLSSLPDTGCILDPKRISEATFFWSVTMLLI